MGRDQITKCPVSLTKGYEMNSEFTGGSRRKIESKEQAFPGGGLKPFTGLCIKVMTTGWKNQDLRELLKLELGQGLVTN